MTRDTALADHTVLVAGDRIVRVAPSGRVAVPEGARRVDGRGAFLIPGLADMHVHVDSAAELSRMAAAGITTVRNMRGAPTHLAWRDSTARGLLAGPTIFTSGPSLRRPPLLGRGDRRFAFPRSEADAERIVLEQARAGYDMIKVLYGFDLTVYRRVLATARRAGIPVVGHVIDDAGLERSIALGQASFEHAADLGAVPRAGTWVGTIVSSRDGRCGPPSERERTAIRTLRRVGARFLAGSDAGIGPVPHETGLHCELETLARAGLTPYEALAAATSSAGAFARAHLARSRVPFGTVTEGARADLVLLRADPRRDLRTLRRPLGVVLRGAWRPAR